jgi:hypothetical protein
LSSSVNVSDDQLISSFNEIFLLFSTSNEFQVNATNVHLFQYLAEKLNNSNLLTICQNVIETNQSQLFFLTSDSFSFLSDDIFHSLNNFKILLQTETIDRNSTFASLISNRISKQISKINRPDFIDFSNYQSPRYIQLFFNIFKGSTFQIDENNLEGVLNVIYFLEMDTISIQSLISNFPFNFASNDIMPIFFLPVDSIQTIISSPHLHLKNEKQLFELILKLIQDQRDFLCLLSNSYFGNIDSSLLNCLIQSIQLNELNDNLFNHLK